MAQQFINIGTVGNDNTGDWPREVGQKVNGNFGELYSGKADRIHTHASGDISDATTAGRNLLTAPDSTTQRTLLGIAAASATSLDGLTDVAVTTPASGHVIRHNGTQFVNVPLSVSVADLAATGTRSAGTFLRGDGQWTAVSGDGGASTLDGLTDVTVSTPAGGQVLRFNGAQWVNAPIAIADVAGAQPQDAGLTSLAALNGLGVVVQTAADSFSVRAIGTGTAQSVPDTAAADARYSALGHTHDAAAVTGGVFPVARLGGGTPTTTTFLRGDGTWAVVPGATGSFQAQDAGLTSLAALTGVGVVTATGTDAFAMRGIGVAASTDIPDRAAADTRYAALGHTHAVADIIASGTRDGTTYLRGDGTWSVPAGGAGGGQPLDSGLSSIAALTGTGVVVATATDVYALRPVGTGTAQSVPDTAAADARYSALGHGHSGADITSGTVAPARLGTGTANSTTYLRGDGAWATGTGSGSVAGYDAGTPALLRGTVSASLWSGVVKGTGLTQTARQANRTALQGAIDYAGANRKFFEIEPGTYQFEGAALNITGNNFVWRGARDSDLVQFSTNVPVLRIGNADNTTAIEGPNLRGVGLYYGVSQTGQTGANALTTHDMWFATIDGVEMECGWTGTAWVNPPYRGFYADAGADGQFWFSNTLKNVKIKGAQQSLMELKAVGTGNVYENIYLANGTNAGGESMLALNGPALYVSSAGVGNTGDQWTQLNIEWTAARYLLRTENSRPTGFRGLHFEGNVSTGDEPSLIFTVNPNSQLNIENMDITNHRFLASRGMTSGTTGSVFSHFNTAVFNVRGLAFYQYTANQIDQQWRMVRPISTSAGPEHRSTTRIEGVTTVEITSPGLSNFAWSDQTPAADAPPPTRQLSFTHHDMFDVHEGAAYGGGAGGGAVAPHNGLDQDFTVYGQHRNIRLIYKATVGATRTVTLSGVSKSTGAGASAPVAAGTVATVVRMAGTVSGTVNVLDATASNANRAAITAAGAYRFRFNGTNWLLQT